MIPSILFFLKKFIPHFDDWEEFFFLGKFSDKVDFFFANFDLYPSIDSMKIEIVITNNISEYFSFVFIETRKK